MANKEIDLKSLLSLEEQIQRELGAMEANINQLPQGGISRDLYGDYMARFNRIRSLFDRTSELLRDVSLEQTTPDLYDILLTKERISNNYNIFNRMHGRFMQQYNKGKELDEGRGERVFAPPAPDVEEEERPSEEDHPEETPDGPSDEEIEAALAEEEAAEAEAAEKKKKAAKKARQEKVTQEERDAIERDRAQKEAERRNLDDQRRMEDRRLEDDRLARDAMLASELHKMPFEDPAYPEQFNSQPPTYEPSAYERTDRGFERYPEDHRFEPQTREYERPDVTRTPSYQEQERFYPPRQDDMRHEPQYPGREEYPESPRFEERRHETPRYEEPSYTPPISPDYEDRRQTPQSAADIRDRELRDADQRAREAQRREEIRQERDDRFERYRDRQQGGFTREDQQFGHFDYSVREGETGRREHGHSDYKSYDPRENPTYTAYEYAPGGTTQRPMPVGSPSRNDAQRFYSTPSPEAKTVTPEHLEQQRYEVQNARIAFEQAKGTPDAEAAETRYQALRHSYEDTFKRVQNGSLEVTPPPPVNHVDFHAHHETPSPQSTHYESAYPHYPDQREYGRSDHKPYTAYEYAPGGTTQRPMPVGSPSRNDAQRSYSAPTSDAKRVTPEYLEQQRYEMHSARLAYEQAKGTPDAKAAETRYQALRHSYEDTFQKIRSGKLEVTPPSSVNPVDFQARAQENHRRQIASPSSTQYNYLPGGGIAGSGISSAAPNGAVSYFNARRDTPPKPASRQESGYPNQSSPASKGTDSLPVQGLEGQRHYRNEPVSPATQRPSSDYKSQRSSVGSQPVHSDQTIPGQKVQHPPVGSQLPRRLPNSFRPLPNAASAYQPSRPDPVSQINKVVASRKVLRNDPMPSPVPAGPRHFHINVAKSNPEVSQISQIPGYFGKQQESFSLGGKKPYILKSFAAKGVIPNAPGNMGSSGQSKDGSSGGNGPRKGKVEETSSDLLNRKSKLHTESIAKHYSRIITGKMEGYAVNTLMMASRRFYSIAQSGEDNALRTLEQGRYYGTVAIGLADAYMHRKPVSSKHAIKSAGRREFREYGRFATMDKKQLTRNIHESLKSNRQLKNEIRELMAKGSNLTLAERAELLKKRAQLMANSMEPRKMHGYRNMQATHARNIQANKQIEKASEGGRITTKTVEKAMKEDFKAREASMAKKFGSLNRVTDKSLRLEIQQKTELGRALKKEIKELKALQASGVKLTPAQKMKLKELLAKREANNKTLRQLHGLKKARLESNLSQKALQNKMTRLAKNKAAVRGGLYALYGIIVKPIREGSEIGAQGLLKFANIATNHYVHEFIKRSLRAAKKTYLWGAKITRFNKTKFYTDTAKKAKKVSSAMKGAPKKVVKATGRVIKKGAIHTYDKVAPVKVKTAVTSAYNRYTGAKGFIVGMKQKAAQWFSNTWVGRTYSSVSHFFGKVGRGISSVLNAMKAVLAKVLLFLLILVLLFQLITMIAGSGGSVSGSIILSPYDGPDGKLDLGPYNTVLEDEWDEYMDDLQQIGIDGGYYKVVVDMDVNPDNVKEILSMMAVRCGQELDLLKDLQVRPYIEDLLRASHPYWTETSTVTCDNIDTCTNKEYCSEDGSECFSDDKLCSHGHTVRHRDYDLEPKTDPDTGKITYVKKWYTYYTWSCSGHCGGHPMITFHVRTLSFDEIFEVDPHGYPTSSTATASTGGLRGYYTITHYCNEKYPHTCNAGPPYKTATGTEPTPGRTIAVDPSDIALGAHVVIDGHEYVAEDTGGAVDGKHIDILVNTHAEALQKGTRYNVPVYKIKYDGESMEESGEWSGWTDDNREWVKAIYEQDWTELYCGIPNVTDEVGRETDLSGVKFVNGSRPGHQSIVNIARSQEGQVGGRPYWSWYGFDNRVEWCAIFVSWCANRDGVLGSKIPRFALCSDGAEWFVQHGQWAKRGDTTPVAGDIIFFSWKSNSKIDHVGIVIGSDNTNVYTIEGNSRDKCRINSYPLNSSVIYGYGLPNY